MRTFDVTFFALPAACPHPGVKKKQNKKHISKKAVVNLLMRSKMASKSTSRQKLLSSIVPYSSPYGRFHNIHKPHAEAYTHQQFLSDSLERVLVLWIKHLNSNLFAIT
jgi:hypothetical protein